ncbi:hypothetical protein C8A05DRAFT_34473 [Staphylotrichum tortipilum]|uniref:rRNA-processing protein EFG1 n=1 Tax=Staphylotrichum tortipilum TaxID=2831512 RepID=A0AAN6MKR4_9PEZI|nr:hypothetical protein C8A05DRAFT_34473 [Staphylotrichum longicolle]
MGKRPHPDDGEPAGPYEDPARKRMRTNRPDDNRPRKRKPQPVDLDNLNAIKKRARAIERLLARDNLKLPANKQKDLERELAAHKLRIEGARAKKDRSKMIQKYHMVRFFERKKAMRFAKQLEKKIAKATDEDEAAQLKADLHVAQVDIDYAIYFPFMEAYISLYAAAASGEKKDDDTTAAQYLRTPRPPMWSVVEKTREEGQAALERLQNRRAEASSSNTETRSVRRPAERKAPTAKPDSTSRSSNAPAAKPDSANGSLNRRERRKEARAAQSRRGKADEQAGVAQDEADESDGGGFFE